MSKYEFLNFKLILPNNFKTVTQKTFHPQVTNRDSINDIDNDTIR